MIVIWEQVLILFLFAFVGFCLGKKKLVGQEQARVLSTLSVYVFLPCRLFKSFSGNVTVSYMMAHGGEILLSAGIVLIMGTVAHFVAKVLTKVPYERSIYEYSMTSSNFAYMGYALAGSLYGETALINMMFFGLPVTVYNYTRGFCMLTKKKLTPKQLLQPSILAILLGSAVGLSGLPVPSLPGEVVTMASSCMAPISMLLTGIVVSGYSLRALFGHKPLYFVTALRLVMIPCLLGIATKLIYPPALPSVLLLYAMPNGLNTILFPRLVGENCEIGAGLACVSTALSCVTIPLILSIFL